METTITADTAEAVTLDLVGGAKTTQTARSAVRVLENPDNATVTIGSKYSGGFAPFSDGEITVDDGEFTHGKGEVLQVMVTGITASPVIVSHREA